MSDQSIEYRQFRDYVGYRVGNDGSVWTCKKKVSKGHGGGSRASILTDEWKRMKATPDNHGYVRVSLRKNGKSRTFYIHILVLICFVGECPDGMEACHFPDRNPTNNRVDNLRWDTPKSNQNDRFFHGTDGRGEKNGCAILSESQVRYARTKRDGGATYKSIGLELGVHPGTIYMLCHRKNWSHVV